jgi:hypothetical protein
MPSEIGKNVLPGDPYNLPDFARNFLNNQTIKERFYNLIFLLFFLGSMKWW